MQLDQSENGIPASFPDSPKNALERPLDPFRTTGEIGVWKIVLNFFGIGIRSGDVASVNADCLASIDA